MKNRLISGRFWQIFGLTIITFLFLTGAAMAATYYVSPSGSDSNSGISTSAPWATFSHAISSLQPGDVLYLMDGTYYQPLTVNKSGTSSAYITIA
ncbi:MAG: hypothetical protein M0033_08225, partial [Nitrospiraceae bacterium]|nr:hypothetical protein [Nitrospiraceae bacterium]